MPSLPFGTASAYTDAFPSPPPRQMVISSETCFNMTMFRDTVKQYRKLDDQIITRLNRAQAQLRDQSRISRSSDAAAGTEGMCLHLWEEMMAGWAHRQTMLSYCLQTVNASVDVKKPAGAGPGDDRLEAPVAPDGYVSRRGWKEEEVVANQLANEETVEAIVRKRSLDAFKSRCSFFSPPPNSPSRAWWDLANSGRKGRGPDLA